MSRLPVSLVVSFACILACKGQDGDGTKEAGKGASEVKAEVKEEPKAEVKGETEAGAETTGEETQTETGEPEPAPTSFEKVGVEICDQYITAYVACIDTKVPEAERDAQRRVLDEQVRAWTQMASSGPSAEVGLQTGCRGAREQAKQATADWGCEW